MKSAIRKLNATISKVEYMENRLHSNNVWVLGIPENAKGNDPIQLAEQWLIEILGKDHLSSLLVIERAHRVYTRLQKP